MRPRSVLAAHVQTARLAATSVTGDGLIFLADYGLRLIRVVVLLALWQVLYADRGTIAGMTLALVLSYALLSEALAEQLNVRTDIEVELWQGTIARRLLRPMSIVGQLMAETLGRWSIGLLVFSLPLLLAAPWLGIDLRPASPLAAGLFGLSLILAITVGLALEIAFGVVIVILDEGPWVVVYIRSAIVGLLSGATIPLPLYPWGLGDVIAWLPFAAMTATPLQVYLGIGEPVGLILAQIGWALVLWVVAGWLWLRHRERFAVYDVAG